MGAVRPVWVPQSLSFYSPQVIHRPPHTMTAGSQSLESTVHEDRLLPLPYPCGSHQAQVGSPRETGGAALAALPAADKQAADKQLGHARGESRAVPMADRLSQERRELLSS